MEHLHVCVRNGDWLVRRDFPFRRNATSEISARLLGFPGVLTYDKVVNVLKQDSGCTAFTKAFASFSLQVKSQKEGSDPW